MILVFMTLVAMILIHEFSHLCFDIQWYVFSGINCIPVRDVQELNI